MREQEVLKKVGVKSVNAPNVNAVNANEPKVNALNVNVQNVNENEVKKPGALMRLRRRRGESSEESECGANGDPSESILSKDYQLRLNLRVGGLMKKVLRNG